MGGERAEGVNGRSRGRRQERMWRGLKRRARAERQAGVGGGVSSASAADDGQSRKQGSLSGGVGSGGVGRRRRSREVRGDKRRKCVTDALRGSPRLKGGKPGGR